MASTPKIKIDYEYSLDVNGELVERKLESVKDINNNWVTYSDTSSKPSIISLSQYIIDLETSMSRSISARDSSYDRQTAEINELDARIKELKKL